VYSGIPTYLQALTNAKDFLQLLGLVRSLQILEPEGWSSLADDLIHRRVPHIQDTCSSASPLRTVAQCNQYRIWKIAETYLSNNENVTVSASIEVSGVS
jgi:hypothetical protein